MDKKFELIHSILIKDKGSRTEEELETLLEYTSSIEFFDGLFRKGGADLQKSCCKALTYKEFSESQTIFNYGDEGSDFYIVLKGQVSVLIPTNSQHEEGNTATELQETVRLGPGESFGELSLVKNWTRSATTVAAPQCSLLVLSKKDYDSIAKSTHENYLENSVLFLKSLPAFRHWSKNALSKLIYHFRAVDYKKGDCVYLEGTECEKVYIIKAGEFKFIKNFTVEVQPKCNLEELTDLNRTSIKSFTGILQNPLKKRRPLQISLKSQNEMFGFEEMLENQSKRNCSCICSSDHGKLLEISLKDFNKRVNHPDTLTLIKQQHQVLNKWKAGRLKTLKSIEKFKFSSQYSQKPKTKDKSASPKAETKSRVYAVPEVLKTQIAMRAKARKANANRTANHSVKRTLDISSDFVKCFETELPSLTIRSQKPRYKQFELTHNSLNISKFKPRILINKPKN